MPQPRFTFLNPGARRIAIVGFGTLPVIDKTRVTANLIRQSGKGADIEYVESREHQLGLQDYSALLYGDDTPRVLLYDEGAGVSGQKRIDQRKVLDRLYRDINAGIVGTIVVGREDRLFRNKHMDQVGPFTKLCEEKRVKIIVPSTESGKTRVYDFTRYQDLLAFQEKMKEAYGYIEGHVKYMQQCQHEKADKGGYDGRTLPPGFAVKGRKQDQIIVVYEPWAEVMRKLALRARALDWDMGKLNREVAQQAYLFREIPDEAREKYIIKTTLRLIPEVGYKPRNSQTIKQWLTNVMYIGWWKPDLDKPDTIPGHHDAILDYALFAEGYARLTGYTLDGVPVDSPKGVTRIRKTRDTPPDALFHGRLLATPPSQDRTTYTSVDEDRAKLYYRGYSAQEHGMLIDKLFSVPVAPFDAIVIERLKALVAVDKRVRDRVKTTLEQVYDQQSTDFVSVNDQLEGIKKQLGENAKKRMKTSVDDPLYAMLEEELNDLQQRQKLNSTVY
ncbi:MAG: hypothetical protein E6J34_20415 [Chloroflexi bacterium]|nr:MAG: hypothetical protein E6J34_20415 [Chloroflexota bacterium]